MKTGREGKRRYRRIREEDKKNGGSSHGEKERRKKGATVEVFPLIRRK